MKVLTVDGDDDISGHRDGEHDCIDAALTSHHRLSVDQHCHVTMDLARNVYAVLLGEWRTLGQFGRHWWTVGDLLPTERLGDGDASGLEPRMICVSVARAVHKAGLDQDRRLVGAIEKGEIAAVLAAT